MGEEEIWADVEGFDSYLVSTYGRIKNWRTGRVLSPSKSGNGVMVLLRRDGKSHAKRVARLVADAFSQEVVDQYVRVKNIDGDIWNNHIENLMVYERRIVESVRDYDEYGNVIKGMRIR